MSLSVNELTTQSSASSFINDEESDEETVALYVTAVEYTDDEGYPTIHLFGRDSDRQKYHVTVDGHHPHFFVPVEEYNSRVENHHAVYDTHRVDDTSLDGESLVKIETYIPSQVSDLRDLFDNPLEADVFYTDRWLIDTDVYTGVEIPVSSVQDAEYGGTKRASTSVDAIEPCDPPEVQPRVVTVDIEVAAEDGVPDASDALWPISTIVAYDSYTDEYVGWLLQHESHDVPSSDEIADRAELDECRVFTDESDLLHDFNTYIGENSYDIFTGWFCIPEDGEVKMSDGSEKPICDIEEGETVVGKDGEDVVTTDVVRKEKVGEKETVTVETQFGDDLTVSYDHPVLVADDGEPRYVEAADVTPGQYVLTPIDLPADDPGGGHTTEMAERLGLIASDGSYSSDDGVVFYNNRDELHNVFNTDNALSEANGTKKQRVFTNMSRDDAVSLCTDIGLPDGRKDRNKWDLSNIYAWDDESIAAFLGGMFSGDGCISDGSITFANGNDSARYWIRTLLRRIGIWATDDGEMNVIVGSSSVEEFANKIGPYVTHSGKKNKLDNVENSKSARTETVPPFFDGGEGVGTAERRIVNDKKRRGINIKRHEIEALGGDEDAYSSFVFDRVENVSHSGAEIVYDIETETHNFVADERVVHNCNDFDYPYLINRSKQLSVWSYQQWSPLEDVWVSSSRKDPVIGGATPFDMIDGYEKTQIHELDSKALDDVVQEELGMDHHNIAGTEGSYERMGKVDIELSHTEMWKQRPVKFLRYNKVDVELVVEIEAEQGIFGLYDALRNVSGAQLDDCHAPIDMLDVMFLREAKDWGYRLPTASEQGDGWFYGGYVFDMTPGIHEHCLYPDVASEYPSQITMCNISPETLVGTQDELDDSQYTEDDCYWSYVDTRPDSIKEESDPEYERLYYLKPSVKEGFVSNVVENIMVLTEQTSGTRREALKRTRNGVWGYLGDSDSYNTGSRLFNKQMAESITLGGRKVIQYSGERFVENAPTENARVVSGDSVPATEVVQTKSGVKLAKDVAVGDSVWSEEGWTEVRDVIKKPNKKQLYTIRTKHGVVHVTEDHSLLRPDGTEVSPTDVAVGDKLLHNTPEYEQRESGVNKAEAWIYGLFAAEGSCGTYESDMYTDKSGWAINNKDKNLLRCAKSVLEQEFGLDTTIDDTIESSNTYKLRLQTPKDSRTVRDVVSEWRESFYTDKHKVVPHSILQSNNAVKQSFIHGFHVGDGHTRSGSTTKIDEMWSKSPLLAQQLATLLRGVGYEVTIDYRDNYGKQYYRIRTVDFHRGDPSKIQSIETYESDDDYVYDFETENHHFHAGVGDVIVHNTDSVVTSLPTAESGEQALDWGFKATERTNEDLESFCVDTFGLDSTDDANMVLELEDYSERMFMGEAKKRYVTLESWNDSDGWLDEPELSVKGYEYVRSDVAEVTKEAQEYVFNAIMRHSLSTAHTLVTNYIRWLVDVIESGTYPLQKLGTPFGIGQSLDEYGSPSRSPQPAYRGARYANEVIYEADVISEGDKPLKFYVTGVGGEYPSVYPTEWDNNAAGDRVDAVSVQTAADLPQAVTVDTETMIDKTLRDPLGRIFAPLGWNIDEMLLDSEQRDLSNYF